MLHFHDHTLSIEKVTFAMINGVYFANVDIYTANFDSGTFHFPKVTFG